MAGAAGSPATRDLHVLMFPFVAFGHITPFLHLSRKLCAAGVRVTFISTPANLGRISSLLPTSPSFTVLTLPLPFVPGLPEGSESTADVPSHSVELLKVAVDQMQPRVASLLADLHPDFVFFDFFQHWVPSIANPLGIKTIFLLIFCAASLAYLGVPARNSTIDYICDLTRPPSGFPASTALSAGIPAYQAADLTSNFRHSGSSALSDVERVIAGITSCSAIAAKTCTEMEAPYIRYAEQQLEKPILLVGPVVPDPPTGELGSDWTGFLNRFDDGTVIFCCFGSETTLGKEAAGELLLGLELTGLPFLAVVKGGIDAFSAGGAGAGRGLVREGWAPQQLILRHRSVGCFVSHAGLSTIVEGIVAGCKLVMLPQKGDQFFNARLFSGDLGVGLEVEREEGGGFRKEAVRDAVVRAMKGEDKEKFEKLRGFFMNDKVQERFMEEFVGKLKELAYGKI